MRDATYKAVAKKIKAAGLQKLKWYCEMCKKQCRDDNGFKNHCLSESHMKNMKHFSQHKGSIIASNSQIFSSGFIRILAHRHSTNRVHSNLVYQEYIADKSHIHLSGTRWGGLREFCFYLDRNGIAKVEETDKGIFLTWIDNNLQDKLQKEKETRKLKADRTDQERDEVVLQEIMSKAATLPVPESSVPTELKRESDGKISFNSISLGKRRLETKKLNSFGSSTGSKLCSSRDLEGSSKDDGKSRKMTALEQIMQDEIRKKQKLETR